MKQKVYVVGGDNGYANWMNADVVQSMGEATFVVFTGGEDVSPGIYGHRPHPTTYSNWRRDAFEMQEFKKALALGLPVVGICRGSQFLCAMAGGMLIQHQQHKSRHLVDFVGDWKYKVGANRTSVTSTHHQRQYPWDINCDKIGFPFEIVAIASDPSPFSEGQDADVTIDHMGQDVEIAIYQGIKALAIQSHPEFCFPPSNPDDKHYIECMQTILSDFLMNHENKL